MNEFLKSLNHFRLYAAMGLYTLLSLFAPLLVFATFTYWPFSQGDYIPLMILLQGISGISASITGIRMVLRLWQCRDTIVHASELLDLQHLLSLSFCMLVTSLIFTN